MRRWIVVVVGALVVWVLLLAGAFVQLRGTTRFDERAYPGSSWTKKPGDVFADFGITLPECTAGKMRYWAGSLILYLKITAPADCVDRFIEANALGSPAPMPGPPQTISNDRRAIEFGWTLPADRAYSSHRREHDNVETQACVDDEAERSLFLRAWHQ